MSIKTNQKKIPDKSTQRYLPFSQIRDNVIIMKDDSVRIVLKCSAINLLLKSQEEQEAIIINYQRFLNSLRFPVQIIVRSKKLNIENYLKKLKDLAVKQTNSLLQNQTYEYINYLEKIIETVQIMKKEFYIVIPFDNEEDKSVRDLSLFGMLKNFWGSVNGQDDIIKIKSQLSAFTKNRKSLYKRANEIKSSLESIGIKAKELDKNELITFLMDYYNPHMGNFKELKNDVNTYDLI